MTRLDLDNPQHVEILLALAEGGWKSGVVEDFDIDAFVEDTKTLDLPRDPKDPQ